MHRNLWLTGLAFLIGIIPVATPAQEDSPGRTLRSAHDVRNLSYEQAGAGPPVVLEVTVISHLLAGFDGQDETGGLFFRVDSPPPVGEKVRVFGKVTGGMYEPFVILDRFESLGAVEHPEPLVLLHEHIQTGVGDNRWIEATGLLMDVQIHGDQVRWAQAILVTGAAELKVRFRNHYQPFQADALSRLSGARVRIRGSGAPLFNNAKQRIGLDLVCPGLEFVSVLEPAPSPELLPQTPLAEIRSWNYRQDQPGLTKTRGVVTFIDHEESRLVIQNQDSAAPVRVSGPFAAIKVGSTVDVVGLPESVGFFVGLRLAKVEEASPALKAPDPVPDPSALSAEFPYQVVTVTGRLAEKTGHFFSLQTDADTLVPVHGPMQVLEELPGMGSELSVTGVKWIEAEPDGELRSVAIELRNSGDVRVLSMPPWWTPARYLTAIGLLVAGILAALAWNTLLRRRVRNQTARIQEEIENKATLEERNRIARELHDTLAQGFSGVAYQLSSVRNHLKQNPQRAGEKLDLAIRMVEHSLAEARHSLANLRSPSLDEQPLTEILESSAEQLCGAAGIPLEKQIGRLSHAIPGSVQHEILRIAMEAITNAIRHSRPTSIRLRFEDREGAVFTEVRDDGKGFEPDECSQSEDHFGLRGMCERARRIGAQLDLQSAPGQGTHVKLLLPV